MLGVAQVEASENGRPLVQGSPTECVCACMCVCVCQCVSVRAIRCNSSPLHLKRGGRRDKTIKSNNIEHLPILLPVVDC